MLKITLYQMRRNIGRLIAAGIAIAIGTAFVAATFVGGQALIQTAEKSITASLGEADLSSTAGYTTESSEGGSEWTSLPFTPAEVAQIADVPGVSEVNLTSEFETLTLTAGDKSEYMAVNQTATNPALQIVKVISGTVPVADTDVAIPQKALDRLGLEVGDQATAVITDYPAYDNAIADGKTHEDANKLASTEIALTITGITDDFRGAFTHLNGAAVMTGPGWAKIAMIEQDSSEYQAERVLIAVDKDADIISVQAAVNEISSPRSTYTPTEVAENSYFNATGEANIIMTFVLVFAALALFVAGLVITNTFQVLVAQRAKTLALLRCVGANKKQIRNSVLVEAAILGFLSSVAGVIIGLGLMQATLSILSQFDFARGIPEWITVPATAIWVPLLAGTVVTVLASLVPARIATKVPPLAALRPQEGSGEESKKAGKVRLVLASILVLGGAALIAMGFVLSKDSLEISLVSGIFGGMLTFIGLIISSVTWIPKVVGAFGKLVSVGASTKIASANTLRNPRRTAATATALFIGVTLVAMMSVGAATARSTFNALLDDQFPIDIIGQAGWSSAGPSEIKPEDLDRVKAIDGVAGAAIIDSLNYANIELPEKTDANGDKIYADEAPGFLGISTEDAKNILRTPEIAEQYDDNRALMPAYLDPVFDGETAWVYVSDTSQSDLWEEDATKRPGFDGGFEITATKGSSAVDQWIVTPQVLEKIQAMDAVAADMTSVSTLIIKVADLDNAGEVVDQLRDVFGEDSMYFTGSVMERLQFQQMIDVILLVLVGLLAVAVVIALIGVANTLSLSVIERRRESATLRAIGMSKRQLKRSLGVEGMLIAGIGAFVGIALGVLYAYIGTKLLLGGFTDVQLSIRWIDVVVILAIALLAGLLASVVPARGAANTSPVEALATD